MHPFADRVHDLVVAGFINAKSVGFYPNKKVFDQDRGGWDYLENTLIEHSYVGLPANVDAVIDGRAAPDVAAVRKWFGRSGEPADEIVLDLEDEDEDVGLDAHEITAAVRTLIPSLVAAEVARLRGRLLDPEIDLDAIDGDDFDPARNPVDRALLVDAVKVAVPAMVRAQINRLRGRID